MSLKKNLVGLSAGVVMGAERLMRGTRMRPVSDAVKNVLILEYMLPLGCCVHLTPVYEAIKRSRPEAVVSVATRGLGLGVLRHNPFVDHVIETSDPLKQTGVAARELKIALASLGIHSDCVFTGASDQRTRIGLMALLAGAGWRGGYTQAPQLYQRPLAYDWKRSLIDNNLRLVELAGCDSGHLEPRVFFSQSDADAAKAMAQEVNPEGKPLLVMVTQNSGGQRTGWHEERFVQVIRYACETLGCAVAYVGTASDRDAVEQLRAQAGGLGSSLTGRTSVTELAALLALSDAVVSLDTGTMHVGRAVGVPMVVIGPSWQRPLEWLPLEVPRARVLRGADRSDIPAGYKLDEVQAADVIAALNGLLATYPPDETSRMERIRRGLSAVDHRA
jgi:ADP-heptose:LPS heptosyltransferase